MIKLTQEQRNTLIRKWKKDHRIEAVMMELGETFDKSDSHKWRGISTPGLVVNLETGKYELNGDSSDLYKWLRNVKGYPFEAPIGKPSIYRLLSNRKPDAPREFKPQAVQAEIKPQIKFNDEGKPQPVDRLQEKAFEIAGEKIRDYFTWSHFKLSMYLDDVELTPVYAPRETKCGRCKSDLNWHIEKSKIPYPQAGTAYQRVHVGQIPVIAYRLKKRVNVSSLGLVDNDELKELFDEAKPNKALREKIEFVISNFDNLLEVMGEMFKEVDDGILCEKCAWAEYDFQIALRLVQRSAWIREDEEYQERQRRDRERWIGEERERERQEQVEQIAWENEYYMAHKDEDGLFGVWQAGGGESHV